MITLSSPRLSFIQFKVSEGLPPSGIILPIVQAGDLYFQVLLTAESSGEADTIDDSTINFSIYSPDGTLLHDYAVGVDNTFYFYRINELQVLAHWHNGFPGLLFFVPNYTCFNILLTISGGDAYASNFLKYISNGYNYTTLIEYACDENSYGFIYCAGFAHNRIRLPMYLLKPQFIDEEEVYFKSDGSIKILKSVTRKLYEGSVDHVDEATHEKIKVALSHDYVVMDIHDENGLSMIAGEFRKSGQYEIEWTDRPGYSTTAPAKFKAHLTPYLVRNDNCEVCEAAPPPAFNLYWTFEELDGQEGYLQVIQDGSTNIVFTFVTLASSLNVPIGAVLFVACGADSGTPNTFLQIVKDGFIIYSSDNPSATPNNFEFTIEAGSTYSIISNVHAAPPVLQWLVDNDDATGDNVGRLIITVNGVEQVNENATGVGSITPPIGSAVVITFYDDLASAADEISLTVNDDLLGELYNVSGDGSTPLSYSYTATGQVLVAFGRAYAAAACTPVAVVGTLDAMPNAIAGQPYFYSFAINSDATPTVNLYPSSKPSWMTIAKVGNEIHFTGIPSTIAENVDVMVAVVNCDGAGSIEFVDMINIVWPELTITALYFDTSFSAALNVPIDVDINIINTFSTCFDTCGGSSIGSMQHVPVVTIPAGSLGITYDSLSNTGTNGPHQRVDNAININGTPYNNGATVATGGISVVLHLQQCT